MIVVSNVVIGKGKRGSGEPNDDDHAEKTAIASVPDPGELPKATVYTTLEPCTRRCALTNKIVVRRDLSEPTWIRYSLASWIPIRV